MEKVINDKYEHNPPLATYILDKSSFLLGSHLCLKPDMMEYFSHKYTPFHSGICVNDFSVGHLLNLKTH